MDIAAEVAQHESGMTGLGNHLVHFNDGDEELVADVAEFFRAGLESGEGAVLVATAAHQVGIVKALRVSGIDPSPIVALDAGDTLQRILDRSGSALEATALRRVVSDALDRAAARAAVRHVRVFGEMVALLWERGQVPLAMELESEWNGLARGPIPFTLLCGYRLPAVTEDPAAAARFFDVCGYHTAVRRGAGEPPEAWRRFGDAARDLPGARAFVRGTLGGWGCHAVVSEAAVIVTELATNAVHHARTPFHVSVAQGPGTVRIAVHDESEVAPVVRAYSPGDARGRGLHLVQGLSSTWGVDRFAGRKTVWAELANR